MSTNDYTNEHIAKLRTLLLEDEVQYIKYIKDLPDEIMKILRNTNNTDLVVNKFVSAVQEYVISNYLSIMDILIIEESDEATIEIIQNIVSEILTKYLSCFFVENIYKGVNSILRLYGNFSPHTMEYSDALSACALTTSFIVYL